jgi:AcrR family transcriptional regulator
VLRRAGVSRRTFYDNYTNKQACFISAFDAVLIDWMRRGALAYKTSAPNGIGAQSELGFARAC